MATGNLTTEGNLLLSHLGMTGTHMSSLGVVHLPVRTILWGTLLKGIKRHRASR